MAIFAKGTQCQKMANTEPANKDLLLAIRKKYRNLSRFSALSGITYSRLYKAVRNGSKAQADEVFSAIASVPDRALKGEVSVACTVAIRAEIEKIRNVPVWCYENRVNRQWLANVMDGKVPFEAKKIKELKKLLGITA